MEIPFRKIGEPGWDEKLAQFLADEDIELETVDEYYIKKIEERLECKIPDSIYEYYNKIGVYENTFFMSNLYQIDSFLNIIDSEWRKIINNFDEDDLCNFIVFAESIDGEPVCFEKESGHIYLFTSNPVEKGMIFTDFSDYVLNEYINMQYAHDLNEMSEEDEFEIKDELFENNSLIDENMRITFLFGGYDSFDGQDEDDFDDAFEDADLDYEDDFDE